MRLGISTASLYPLETELALEELCKAGVTDTEIFFNAECELKESFVDILEDIVREYGININAVHPTMSLAEPFTIFSTYERRFNDALRSYVRYSEIAARLGAKYIVMHGGRPKINLSDEEYCERYMQLKTETLKNGVAVLQENVVNYRSGDVEFLHSMRDILGKDAEFCFDIKQAVRSGLCPDTVIEEFLPNIRHFHISDHSINSDCMLPGNGGYSFEKLFGFLRNKGYNGALMIEVYSNAYREYSEIYDSLNKMKKLIK